MLANLGPNVLRCSSMLVLDCYGSAVSTSLPIAVSACFIFAVSRVVFSPHIGKLVDADVSLLDFAAGWDCPCPDYPKLQTCCCSAASWEGMAYGTCLASFVGLDGFVRPVESLRKVALVTAATSINNCQPCHVGRIQ